MAEEEREKKCDAGLPPWLATFADLMSLLMCFFVLLLSFSQMDIEKYKQVAGSLKLAFGVQRQVEAEDVPKGTSIIAREFTAGRPEPTPLNQVKQATTEDTKQTLEFTTTEEDADTEVVSDPSADAEIEKPELSQSEVSEIVTKETIEDANKLQLALKQELEAGLIEMEREGNTIMVRIKDKASFPSGAAQLREDFLPVLEKLRNVLFDLTGNVVVAGHTDDIPIQTARFRSNWELSASRAVSVVHQLLDSGLLDKSRFVVEGHGDAHPLVPNDSPEHRAINRRVELTIVQRPLDRMQEDDAPVGTGIQDLQQSTGGEDTAEPEEPFDAAAMQQQSNQASADDTIELLEQATGLQAGETATIQTEDDGEEGSLRQLTPQELLNLGDG